LADGGEFVGVELVEGFEVEAQVGVGGAAFVGVEDERVCAGVESKGELAEHVEGGLVGAGFVAADVGDVDAAGVGEGLLGEALLLRRSVSRSAKSMSITWGSSVIGTIWVPFADA
jgi:hypothetical protein